MKILIYAIIGAIGYYLAVKIFAIVFWNAAVNLIFDKMRIDEFTIEEGDNDV